MTALQTRVEGIALENVVLERIVIVVVQKQLMVVNVKYVQQQHVLPLQQKHVDLSTIRKYVNRTHVMNMHTCLQALVDVMTPTVVNQSLHILLVQLIPQRQPLAVETMDNHVVQIIHASMVCQVEDRWLVPAPNASILMKY